MIDVNELRKGVTFTMGGALFKVLEYQHHKPGRGKAIIRTTLRNLRTGATTQQNFTSGDRVDNVRVERRGVQIIYQDGDLYYFMDAETYEQLPLPSSGLGDQMAYLKEGLDLMLVSYEGEAIDIELPTNVDMLVVDAEMAVAGNTATGATKKVTVESGLSVQVPMFVEQGDVIRVDTRSGEYVTRV